MAPASVPAPEKIGIVSALFLAPWPYKGWFLWVPPSIIVRNWTPGGAGMDMKVLWDNDLAPLSSVNCGC